VVTVRYPVALMFAAFALGLSVAIGLMIALGAPQLPAGFTVGHADGATYVCSTHPVYCTGNR
jgi:hypothetical protein